MKKIAALVLALVLTLACVSVLAEDAVYSCFYTTEKLAGETDFNGFVTGCGLSEYNAIVLKDDGTYEYTKLIGTVDAEGTILEPEGGSYVIRYVFTGTYTKDGDQVTLNVPEECVFSEDWGPLVPLGYMHNCEGSASNGDRVSNYDETQSFDPLDCFSHPLYKFDGHDTPVSITVNADGSYTYNVAASSDDD